MCFGTGSALSVHLKVICRGQTYQVNPVTARVRTFKLHECKRQAGTTSRRTGTSSGAYSVVWSPLLLEIHCDCYAGWQHCSAHATFVDGCTFLISRLL